ncbi:MAG TPA: T9SS type A sorting domain-containing protein, partial [Bacteroidetes bacterium]|nr:T9SS type A sorting domain-containing protein [Bacteroidota bacterium]
TVVNACGIDSIVLLVPVTCEVGIAASLAGHVQVYPNPGTGMFWIRIEDVHVKRAGLKVRDAFGKTVLVRNLGALAGDRLEDIDLSQLASGMYFLELNVGAERLTKKLLLQQ